MTVLDVLDSLDRGHGKVVKMLLAQGADVLTVLCVPTVTVVSVLCVLTVTVLTVLCVPCSLDCLTRAMLA